MEYRGYFWQKQIDPGVNPGFFILGYTDESNSNNNLEAWIAPSRGSNLCRFSVGGQAIIDFEPQLLNVSGDTGTLVLYPTPNRVRDGTFRYQGRDYPQIKRANKIMEHGMVRDEGWNFGKAQLKEDSISLLTWINFDRSSPLFEAFPFAHRLELEFCLMRDGIRISYTIQNMDDQDIPFGFGLHPYFMKVSGENGTFVRLPARYVMESTPDLLPTGKLLKVDQTPFDLKREVKIGALDLDHVFTGVPDGEFASIHFSSLTLRVILEATNDFSHIVLYSPAGQGYFCLENQTCSTDAHNLYDRGYQSESGLKLVKAGQIHTGHVKYSIRKDALHPS
jgi:aldose 1-epimerase